MIGKVMRAHLRPQFIAGPKPETELHIRLRAPVDVVGRVDGPACRATGRGELGHVAREVREAFPGTLYDVRDQLASERLGHILGAEAGGVREEELALLGVLDLELECLARCWDGSSIDASAQLLVADAFSPD